MTYIDKTPSEQLFYKRGRTMATLAVHPTPSNAFVDLESPGATQQGTSITVKRGSDVHYEVSANMYDSVSGDENVVTSRAIDVVLQPVAQWFGWTNTTVIPEETVYLYGWSSIISDTPPYYFTRSLEPTEGDAVYDSTGEPISDKYSVSSFDTESGILVIQILPEEEGGEITFLDVVRSPSQDTSYVVPEQTIVSTVYTQVENPVAPKDAVFSYANSFLGTIEASTSNTITYENLVYVRDGSAIVPEHSEDRTSALFLQTEPTSGSVLQLSFASEDFVTPVTVAWGDGSSEVVTGALEAEHTYDDAGKYTVALMGSDGVLPALSRQKSVPVPDGAFASYMYLNGNDLTAKEYSKSDYPQNTSELAYYSDHEFVDGVTTVGDYGTFSNAASIDYGQNESGEWYMNHKSYIEVPWDYTMSNGPSLYYLPSKIKDSDFRVFDWTVMVGKKDEDDNFYPQGIITSEKLFLFEDITNITTEGDTLTFVGTRLPNTRTFTYNKSGTTGVLGDENQLVSQGTSIQALFGYFFFRPGDEALFNNCSISGSDKYRVADFKGVQDRTVTHMRFIPATPKHVDSYSDYTIYFRSSSTYNNNDIFNIDSLTLKINGETVIAPPARDYFEVSSGQIGDDGYGSFEAKLKNKFRYKHGDKLELTVMFKKPTITSLTTFPIYITNEGTIYGWSLRSAALTFQSSNLYVVQNEPNGQGLVTKKINFSPMVGAEEPVTFALDGHAESKLTLGSTTVTNTGTNNAHFVMTRVNNALHKVPNKEVSGMYNQYSQTLETMIPLQDIIGTPKEAEELSGARVTKVLSVFPTLYEGDSEATSETFTQDFTTSELPTDYMKYNKQIK